RWEQCVAVRSGEGVRDPGRDPRRADLLARVDGEESLLEAEPVERPDGDERPRHRCRREPGVAVLVALGLQVLDVPEDGLLADGGRGLLTALPPELRVAPQGPPMRGAGARGEPPLAGQAGVVLNQEAVQRIVGPGVDLADGPRHGSMLANTVASAPEAAEVPCQVTARQLEPHDALGVDDVCARDEVVDVAEAN